MQNSVNSVASGMGSTHSSPKSPSASPNTSSSTGRVFITRDSSSVGILAVDPLNTAQPILTVPRSLTQPTLALKHLDEELTSGNTPRVEICELYCKAPEKCPEGEKCRRIHVQGNFIRATRSLRHPLCCAKHNDFLSRQILEDSPALRSLSVSLSSGNDTRTMPIYECSLTAGLENLPIAQSADHNSSEIRVRVDQLCRLHQQGRCKWGKQCGYIHLCLHVLNEMNLSNKRFNVPEYPPISTYTAPEGEEVVRVGHFAQVPPRPPVQVPPVNSYVPIATMLPNGQQVVLFPVVTQPQPAMIPTLSVKLPMMPQPNVALPRDPRANNRPS